MAFIEQVDDFLMDLILFLEGNAMALFLVLYAFFLGWIIVWF